MPVDYAEVLKDLEDQEARLVAKLKTIREARPAIQELARESAQQAVVAQPRGRFTGMGPKGALRVIFSESPELRTREYLFDTLKAGGWTTEARDPLATVSASLSQLASDGEIEKVEDRWRKRKSILEQISDSSSMILKNLQPSSTEPPQPSAQ